MRTDVDAIPHRIVIAGGGTGGHVFPALAVADELRRRRPNTDLVFIGSHHGLEQRLVPAAGFPLRSLHLFGLQGAGLGRRLLAVVAAAWGSLRCLLWMVRRRPDLVVGVGGFASGPAVLAARLLRVRTMIIEQNHWPGATNRWLASRVDLVCVPSAIAARYVSGRVEVTGNPVRPAFAAVGDPPAGPRLSLLVFGGSRGARSINRALAAALPELARLDLPPRIVHQTGIADEPEARSSTSLYPADLYEVHAFLDDLPTRLAAADLVLCRAGASTLAELCVAGRPAVLVPYPHAAEDHQLRNAEALVSAGAACLLPDAELSGTRLSRVIEELTAAPELRRSMSAAARALGRPDAARRIADLAETLLSGGRHVS
jgi:UDP-N-acetylglucosamine--N-acetylmuramyl-(pentapeptide) pyrophosphoryl-undecaprenol N-acetylglucosamine transferase